MRRSGISMRLFARFRSWFRVASHPSKLERDMQDELQFHIDACAADLERQGLPAAEARIRARAEFGVLEARKDEMRDAFGLTWIDDARADLRYGFRLLRQSPAFAAVAVVSLALGIGANTAVFSLMETVLWKLLPVKDPQKLKLLWWVSGPRTIFSSSWNTWNIPASSGDSGNVFSYPIWRGLHQASTDVFAFKPAGMLTASIDRNPELVKTEMVSGNAFQIAGMVPLAGRLITGADDETGAPVVALITDGYWTRRFGRDASIIGRRISVNRVPVTIVGVTPPGYSGFDPEEHPDLFVPIASQPLVLPNEHEKNGSLLDDPDFWWVQVMLRARPGVDEARTRERLDATLRHIISDTLPHRKNRDMPRLRLLAGSRGLDVIRFEFGKPLLLLASLAGLVLMIACANLANLLLARATARHREIAVRLALGAPRGRVIRQMFTEGLLLTALGSIAGLLLGYFIRDGIPALLANPWSSAPFRADYDWRVLLISTAVSGLTGLLFSIAPAWRSSTVPANAALKEGSRSSMTGSHVFAGRALAVFQMSLSLVLLVGAGLFVRTLANLNSAELGFNPQRILLFDVDPPRTQYAAAKRIWFFEQLLERLESAPGVQAATASQAALISGMSADTHFTILGTTHNQNRQASTWVNQVGSGFFETMQVPILSGRGIESHDRAGAPAIAVVNRTFASKYFNGENPIGRILIEGRQSYQITGICADARYSSLRMPAPPTVYVAFAQAQDLWRLTYELKTAADTDSIMKNVRAILRSMDPNVPVFDVRTQTEQIDATMSEERLFATLTSVFGMLALVLAAIGIYGVIGYSVTRRTSEIGIRMAIGARRGQVLRMILRECAWLAGLGLAIGLAGAALATGYVRTMLYGLTPADPIALGAAVALLAFIAFAAAWIPARQASRLDPMQALRHE